MPNVALISPKGGAGKTTAALVLALGLAENGAAVSLIDADPNKPLVHWSRLPGRPKSIAVHPAPTVQDVRDAVREAQQRKASWIIVDTEGTERGAMVFAALRLDLVMTPVTGSQLDVREAVKAARIVEAFGKRGGAPLRHRAFLTRVPPVLRPKLLRSVVEELRSNDVPLLSTGLIEKEAFRALFTVGGDFDALEAHGIWGVAAARKNASAFVSETLEVLSHAVPAQAAMLRA